MCPLAIEQPVNPSLPARAACTDWAQLGEFNPERFQGEQRRQYEESRARIEREWDNRGERHV